MHRVTSLTAGALLVAALALGTATSATADTIPSRTDNQCIDTGATGVRSPYWWAHACWSQSNRDWGGADCSGFMIKCWQVPRLSSTAEDYHPYSTTDIFTTTYHWYAISRSSLWKSDAVGYPPPPDSTGHVVMYYYGNKYGSALVLEAQNSAVGIVKHYRDISGSQWRFRRRNHLTQTPGPA